MKYAVLLCDGMADYPLELFGGKTPMEAAKKPCMDALVKKSETGLIKTVADGMKPGSDVANLAVLGYDAREFYSGRSPLEAANIGIDLSETDVATRCNLVTLSDEKEYKNKTMVDYCSDDISSEEAAKLVDFLNEKLIGGCLELYSGVSYRHCLVWRDGAGRDDFTTTPPHDISGRCVGDYLPKSKTFRNLMEKSFDLLKSHPVNLERQARGKRPANSMWLWGSGVKKPLTSFKEKYGVNGAVISAVDLVKGIGRLAGMEVCDVPGATGYIDTDFDGKMQAAVRALREGNDFVYIHVEAPDECGHRNEPENKKHSVELIDEKILSPLKTALDSMGEDYKIAVLPDHPTPISIRTHASDPVPYFVYHKNALVSGTDVFSEKAAASTGLFTANGYEFMDRFIFG